MQQQQAAVIVEPRNFELALPLVILNAISVLPENWQLYLFHGTKNRVLCEELARFTENSFGRRVILVPLASPNLTIPEYNQLLCSTWFWEQIETWSHVLVFQTDSYLLENSSHKIDEFLDFDYVGAPWKHLRNLRGGNGGLSLRRKSAMIDAAQHFSGRASRQPEDVRICRFLAKFPEMYHLPAPEVAQTFSVESIYYPKPFGIHKAYARLNRQQWRLLVLIEPALAHVVNVANYERIAQQQKDKWQKQHRTANCVTTPLLVIPRTVHVARAAAARFLVVRRSSSAHAREEKVNKLAYAKKRVDE